MEDPAVPPETLEEQEKPSWYSWAVSVGTSLASAALAVSISLTVSAQSTAKIEKTRVETDAKWCAIVVVMDDSYRRTPPTTATGQSMARSMSALRTQLRCPATQ